MTKTPQIKIDLSVNANVQIEVGTSGVPVSKFIQIMQMNKMMQSKFYIWQIFASIQELLQHPGQKHVKSKIALLQDACICLNGWFCFGDESATKSA